MQRQVGPSDKPPSSLCFQEMGAARVNDGLINMYDSYLFWIFHPPQQEMIQYLCLGAPGTAFAPFVARCGATASGGTGKPLTLAEAASLCSTFKSCPRQGKLLF